MTKPWEETWTADEAEGGWHIGPQPDGRCTMHRNSDPSAHADQAATAKMIACTPELVRMLLAMEAPHPGSYLCHWCGEHTQNQVPHRPNCKWLALMRKAGVME